MKVVIILSVLNIVTFVLFGIDKYKAEKNLWRISESTLLGLCILGGSIGGLFGMKFFHHKTRKPQFYIGVPVIIVIQAAISLIIIK